MFLLLLKIENFLKPAYLLDVIQQNILENMAFPTGKKIFPQAIVENIFFFFQNKHFFKNCGKSKTLPALIEIGYPQFVPILFYTIFAALFQI